VGGPGAERGSKRESPDSSTEPAPDDAPDPNRPKPDDGQIDSDGKSANTKQPDQYERWLADFRGSLNPVELEKSKKMTGTPREVHDRYQGDMDRARTRVRDDVAKDQQQEDAKIASAARAEEIKQKIAENKIMEDQRSVDIINKMPGTRRSETAVNELRDHVMTRIVAQEAQDAARVDDPNAKVRTGIKVYEKQEEGTTAEWRANNPGKGSSGLITRPDGLFREQCEIDVLVTTGDEDVKDRVLHREEIKTGKRDSPGRAKDQLDTAGELLARGDSGKIRLELNQQDITGEIDMASDAAASKSTRGPAGKGFDESLGINSEDLDKLIKHKLTEAAARRAAGKDTQ
jgi:hypothetical protein